MLAERGVQLGGGRIRLLALPRLLGWGFNPIAIWYCEHADGDLRAVIAEVHNTFGERHHYVLASDGKPLAYDQPHAKDKTSTCRLSSIWLAAITSRFRHLPSACVSPFMKPARVHR